MNLSHCLYYQKMVCQLTLLQVILNVEEDVQEVNPSFAEEVVIAQGYVEPEVADAIVEEPDIGPPGFVRTPRSSPVSQNSPKTLGPIQKGRVGQFGYKKALIMDIYGNPIHKNDLMDIVLGVEEDPRYLTHFPSFSIS
ncbi:hypothetical protein O6H91_19G035200 [Diphasiastrum complanatum]|uniref:Uncharacterized protein n=1 Tax=Diphasiastrum complanatum TaxID=34168 RepID=A0ACC2AU89_DIPCM|nr:hypothetical protein O6H91_19G035200 [Diphasiastrum complanatum]